MSNIILTILIKQRQELHELLWRSLSVSLQSNNNSNELLFVFSFPCGEAYKAWFSDLRHQHNQVWTIRKICDRFGISFRFSKSLSESQKTQGECPNMENVTRHVVLNFRVSIHAWRGSTVSCTAKSCFNFILFSWERNWRPLTPPSLKRLKIWSTITKNLWKEMCCMRDSCDSCLGNLESMLISRQRSRQIGQKKITKLQPLPLARSDQPKRVFTRFGMIFILNSLTWCRLKVDFQSVLRRLSPELFMSLTWWNVRKKLG